jgi:hypothetical protein
MARFAFLAVLTATAAMFAAEGTPPEPPRHPAVAVFLDFDSKPGDTSFAVMKKEAEDLLKSSGISLHWKMVSANQGTEASSSLVVMRFRGRCRAEAWPQPGEDGTPEGTQALGFTQVSAGHVLPFSEIECDQIRKSLNYLDHGSTPGERQKALGMAMGRVVAHELYHMLARTTSHAQGGLAKATQSLRDLAAAPAMAFQDKDSRAIGRGFRDQ